MSVGGSIRVENEYSDNFPVGMRVLAVDDDPTCLKLLECLLKKCQYHVTVTNQARVALEMLRENKDRFDLVISDVHMPDMDGFKLLELVGLEMDLPVIMLSANSDTRVVMKGVTHGACDYLVKPVRVEELQNIWQHVIRRKKFNPKHNSKPDDDKDSYRYGSEEHGPGGQLSGSAEQNEKHNKRRKDESDKNEDSVATQKKARVVWSIELHRKFVAAVNQLGIERAVPKRILDLMNVEGLTRDNVASHLQKYRLYLKRISLVSTPQGNMPTGSGDGFGEVRALAGPGPLNNESSYAPGSMLGRLNSSTAGLGFQNVNSLGLIQPSHSLDPLGKLKLNSNDPPTSQNPSLFQGTEILSGFGSPINAMILPGNSQQGQPGGGFGNPHSLNMTSLRPEPLDTGVNHGNLQNSILASNYNPLMETLTHSQLGQNHVGLNYSSAGSHLPGSPLGYTSTFSTGPSQFWGQNQNQNQNSSSGVPVKGIMPSLNPSGGQNNNNNNDIFNMEMDTSFIGQANGGSMALFQHNENRNMNQDSTMKSNEDDMLNSTTGQDGFGSPSFESLDDLIMNEVAKEGQNGQFGFDAYSFGPWE